jgi:NADH:ubiquinone oxidoreductase subunit D
MILRWQRVLPESIHLELAIEDEKAVDVIPTVGFVHRGLEKLGERKDYCVESCPKQCLSLLTDIEAPTVTKHRDTY